MHIGRYPRVIGRCSFLAIGIMIQAAWSSEEGSSPSPVGADSVVVRAIIPDTALERRKAQQRAILLIDLARRIDSEAVVDTMPGLTADEKAFIKRKFRQLHP